MSTNHATPTPGSTPQTFGERLKTIRTQQGMTRAVLGGLVGRSAEWVKWIETGAGQMPRLPMLLHLARVLHIDDLAELTGEQRLNSATYDKPAHVALQRVKDSLTTYSVALRDQEPVSAPDLQRRVRQAWESWHGFGHHRTRVAGLIPALLADCQHSARHLDGADRRRALVCLAQTYHIAQLYLSFQPDAGLVMLTGDRAMSAAQDADSPHAIASAAWYLNHVFRDAGERHEARVELAMQSMRLLDADRGPEDIALLGLMELAAALSWAKIGKSGDADRHWNRASTNAARLQGFTHPWLKFGQGMVDAYLVTMRADLLQRSAAADAASRVDLSTVGSSTRHGFHLIECARAFSMQGQDVAAVQLLQQAYDVSPETIGFNLFARAELPLIAESGSSVVRGDARVLAHRIRVAA